MAALIADYRRGRTTWQLAEKHGCSQWSVCHALRDAGEPRRRTGPARCYRADEAFFDDINNEDKAYWLGFLLADGSIVQGTITGGWVVRCELAIADAQHLYKLAAAIKTNVPVRFYRRNTSALLALSSVRLGHALLRLECGPNKTGKHGTPVVPEPLRHHFYRGYFDGDGWLTVNARGVWAYGAIGSPLFMAEHQQWLMIHAGVSQTKMSKYGPVMQMIYQGSQQTRRICDLLYCDASVWLERKYRRYRQLCGDAAGVDPQKSRTDWRHAAATWRS